ncbi:hypothetical protein ACFQY7_19880 [Actinomadura luteofluorescens]|uniref:hypothetical protein n=1 Tax=Actinomadura luteofluorescens TaxID=46163 RepID=UPI00363718F9
MRRSIPWRRDAPPHILSLRTPAAGRRRGRGVRGADGCSAWACPPEPEKTQTEQAAATGGEGAGGHAGHYHRAAAASTKSEAVKGVRRVGGVPDAKGAISLMFMDYGQGATSGRSCTRPASSG